ncbi:MAG: hypothetical protein DBX55_01695 [Verrucomicrobia bacterium]|nr:MAG: hypothetical protein DBX55_01695 [Verrucomicrobiota bacterium]
MRPYLRMRASTTRKMSGALFLRQLKTAGKSSRGLVCSCAARFAKTESCLAMRRILEYITFKSFKYPREKRLSEENYLGKRLAGGILKKAA